MVVVVVTVAVSMVWMCQGGSSSALSRACSECWPEARPSSMAVRKACEAGWGCRDMRAGLKVLILRVMLPEGLLASGVRCPVIGGGV